MYGKPIPMNWGEKKLTQLCKDDIGIDPQSGAVFLFFNSKKDQMKLFFLDNDGSQEFQKLLPQGRFLLPVPKEREKFVKIERKKLNSLFKS
jgi:hypothetical protein